MVVMSGLCVCLFREQDAGFLHGLRALTDMQQGMRLQWLLRRGEFNTEFNTEVTGAT